MSTEIKNTLFRFVTMRAPELSEEKNQEKRFVKKPSSAVESSFNLAVRNRPSGSTKWEAMKKNAPIFKAAAIANNVAIKTNDDVKTINSKLYDFAIWIARNKYSYTDQELIAQKAIVTTNLTAAQLNVLWDNLFYQVVTQQDFYIKESIMQMLIADNLIKNFVNETTVIADLVNAKLVLEKELFVESENASTTISSRSSKMAVLEEQPLVAPPTDEMQKMQEIALAEYDIDRINTLKTELTRLEKKYKEDYAAAYKVAEESHQAVIKPIIDNYTQAVKDAKDNWCTVTNPSAPYDPADPCQQAPQITIPELPPLGFEYDAEINETNIINNLSSDSYDLFVDIFGLTNYQGGKQSKEVETIEKLSINTTARAVSPYRIFDYDNFASLHSPLNSLIERNRATIVNNTPSQSTTAVSIGGVVIPTRNTAVKTPFSYQICPKSYRYSIFTGFYQNAVDFDMSFEVPDVTWQVISVTVKKIATGLSDQSYTHAAIVRTDNSIYLRNILNQIYITEANLLSGTLKTDITITFSNGAVKSFNSSFWTSKNCMFGTLTDVITIPNSNGTSSTDNETENSFIPSGFGVKQLGIADYKKVEQTVQGYVEGEVAHIENIMAREYKEKSTRRLRRSENTTTTSSETEREQLTDTTTASRFEMQSEVAKILQESKDIGIQASINNESIPKTTVFAGGSFASHSSKEQSNSQAIMQAKDITERAMERVASKVKEERIEKIIEEFEENNKHGFDNTKGDKHVVGVFRWVDKVYKNQVVNYGKRLMFEFMIPEPAKLHLLGMAANKSLGTIVEKPADPRTYVDAKDAITLFNLKDYTLINDNTIKYWASKFNVELSPKPESELYVGTSFTQSQTVPNQPYTEKSTIKIPEGYVTKQGQVNFTGMDGWGGWDRRMLASVGNRSFNAYPLRTVDSGFLDIKEYTGEIPVALSVTSFFTAAVTFNVKCVPSEQTMLKWKQETFNAIINAYNDALAEYKQLLAEENAKGNLIKGENPGFYRQIENTVLRKNCISYIVSQNPSSNRTYGQDMSNGKTEFTAYEIKPSSDLDNYAAFAKFIEQAFEWDIMSYNFYPYYWGNRNDWAQLYQYDNNDPLFRSFMQSGMARVIVTVRPGFEEAVSYYMQTGQIWNGGEVPVIEDKLFLSIVDELRQPVGLKEGKAWPTRIPTALTILQADSIGLKVEKALPYDEDLSDFENPEEVPQQTGFHISNSQLNTDVSTKQIVFTYQGMDNNFYQTIGQLDAESAFPRKFSCLGQEFIINRDAAWKPTDSAALVFEKLAGQINLIPGVIAKQFTAANGDASGIQFILDTTVLSRFDFAKFADGPIDPSIDIVNLYITSEAIRFTSPTYYLDRVMDSNGKAIKESEVNTLLPISRFAL